MVVSSATIKEQLQACHSKEDTFRTLVALSKRLPRLSNEEKIEEHKVIGCESAVWLITEDGNGTKETRHFKADSDAKLMRGVLVAILSLVEGQSTQTIQKIDLADKLAELNLSRYLTSSRNNGINAIIGRIKAISN